MSRPGSAASGPQREVFDSARVRGSLLTAAAAKKTERAPILPRGVIFGAIWGTGAPGKGKDQVHSHTWANGTGKGWG